MKHIQYYLFLIILSINSNLIGQTIQGTVKYLDGTYAIGANIIIEELQLGTTTDLNGTYKIYSVPKGKHTLKIKFIGYNEISKNINCFCVGKMTEKKARSLGFQNTISAEGNVSNLKEIILQNQDLINKKLLYFSGEMISVDLDQLLLKEGFNVKRVVNYRTSHNQKFDEKFIKDLKLNIPDIVYIYSQNSALSFLNFVKLSI